MYGWLPCHKLCNWSQLTDNNWLGSSSRRRFEWIFYAPKPKNIKSFDIWVFVAQHNHSHRSVWPSWSHHIYTRTQLALLGLDGDKVWICIVSFKERSIYGVASVAGLCWINKRRKPAIQSSRRRGKRRGRKPGKQAWRTTQCHATGWRGKVHIIINWQL